MALRDLFSGLISTTDSTNITTITTVPASQALGAQNYWVNSTGQSGQSMKGFATYGNSIKQSSPAFKLEALTRYAELVDAKLEHIYLPDNVTTNHPKVSILKLMQDGEVVKDVGLRYDANNFYVFKED